jgi:hypothetical protein
MAGSGKPAGGAYRLVLAISKGWNKTRSRNFFIEPGNFWGAKVFGHWL